LQWMRRVHVRVAGGSCLRIKAASDRFAIRFVITERSWSRRANSVEPNAAARRNRSRHRRSRRRSCSIAILHVGLPRRQYRFVTARSRDCRTATYRCSVTALARQSRARNKTKREFRGFLSGQAIGVELASRRISESFRSPSAFRIRRRFMRDLFLDISSSGVIRAEGSLVYLVARR